MRVIARKTIRDFYERHAASKIPLEAWFHEAEASSWAGPHDIKTRYPSADILPGNRVVFNVKGNTYRLIVKIHLQHRHRLHSLRWDSRGIRQDRRHRHLATDHESENHQN